MTFEEKHAQCDAAIVLLEAWRDGAAAERERLQEPTEAMLNAARDWSYATYGKPIGNDAARGCWAAMLAAAFPGNQPSS